MRITTLFILLNFAFSFAGFSQPEEARFQSVLDSVISATPEAVGLIFHIESPTHNISWTGAAGVSDTKTNKKLKSDQPVLIASNTKTFVAAAILKLIENKNFKLDDPISRLLSTTTNNLLKEDGYTTDSITIKHLLSHTSGIYDYVDDAYFEFVKENPKHQWTREDQISRTVLVGEPQAKPGEVYKYADINFVLLTEIIEQQTNEDFYTSMEKLIGYKSLGLNSTWFIQLEKQPKNTSPLAHQYSDNRSWDSYELNPSWDLYGGGGLASTAKDMALFFQNLFDGNIIKNDALLEEMHTYVLPEDKSRYCLGLMKIDFFKTTTAYYHGGFWGTGVAYFPEYNATISAITLNRDSRELNAEITFKLLKIIQEVH